MPAARAGDGADGSEASERRLDALLRLTRDLLDADMAVLTEIGQGRETARRAAGEWPGMGSFEGAWSPLEETICQRMLEGRIGNYIRDAQGDDRVNHLPMVREMGIGSYLGVPIRIDDVHLYVLCCLDRESRPSLGEREVRLLSGLAESVRVELPSLN
ncbi:MAG TPA: GAF domain-containing protein [Solirubrobacteraceae bacterium]|nr:GAF domain-containing protein [Solirubrobacteraceae bacterium]